MTLIKDVFIFVVGLLAYIQSAHASLETVWLKDVTTRFQTDKRTISDLDLPNELTFHLTRGTDALTLNLRRNRDINPNANTYFVQKLKGGQSVLVKTRNLENKDVAYYQDQANGAFMTVKCVKRSNEYCDRVINGHMRVGDRSYDLRPDDNDITSRHLLEVPGLLGKRYVLQDQAHIQSGNSVENKDAPYVVEKKGKQELIALLRRFQGQLKQNHSPPSDPTFSSRNVASLHNTAATDKYQQQKKVYDVKVSVLIDSGIWNIYSSMVHPSHPRHRSIVKRKITEAYSHIMNGVNLNYKEIEDPSISINVFLSEFIFFEKQTDFPHTSSNVMIYNGTQYIEVTNYLKDVAFWDLDINGMDVPLTDVVMLFTGYTLYMGSLHDTDVDGDSFVTGVCESGLRSIVIESDDYVSTVWSATHELGHSLGADDDGKDTAKACKADDSFIMTAVTSDFLSCLPYSRQPWLFSKCSVKAFKETLKYKRCVTTTGIYFNETEYKSIVMKQPGEVYTPNEQCHAINGLNSVLCETVPANICLLMRCTDPKTRRCMGTYFGAASGTECGQNMWCMEQRCVSKFENNYNSP